jgi:hypothetical protein
MQSVTEEKKKIKKRKEYLEVKADGRKDQTLEILNQIVKGAKTLRILTLLHFKKRSNLRGLQQSQNKFEKEE